ncbi:MAG TPA: alpha/beta hydrolase [Candidatus Acidoferrum sp.]|nr:alpha/beta hydrolase [Candidatus Acidoferrum sp.]
MSTAPRVFLDYDQAALDRAYDQPSWAPNMQEVLQRRAAASDAVRARLGAPRTLAYGPTAIEHLDLYPTSRANAPVMVFLHGGAWRGGDARSQAYAAATFVQAGVHWVVPDFATVMDVGLDGMVAQVRRAVAWVARHAASFGGDPARVYVGGHSSGAHLAANVLVTDWVKDFGLPADVVKGGLCVSGMYDLQAVRLSARSSYVKFDDRIEHELSPQRHLARLSAPVVVAYAERDSPEFQRQAREFAEALARLGRLRRLVVGPGLNHFEIPETLASPDGLLGRAALELMRLASPDAAHRPPCSR